VNALKLHFAFLLLIIGLVGCAETVDTTQLDEEITKVQEQLDAARGELELYNGGGIHAMTQMQVKVLETTLAMLEQKRTSWLMMVSLNYDVDNGAHCDSFLDDFDSLEADIASTAAEMDTAQSKADMYRGGLIRTMALAEVATHRMTLAVLNQRQLMAKWDIPLFAQSGIGASGDAAMEIIPAGPVVSDEDAI
tara:strand:+ start:60 stop:638 length:579 start_codon:yes stop_codon:yes gene_type:complete